MRIQKEHFCISGFYIQIKKNILKYINYFVNILNKKKQEFNIIRKLSKIIFTQMNFSTVAGKYINTGQF